MDALKQLALPFRHSPHYATEDVLAAPFNAQALAWLGRTASWPGGRLALWGGAGCGKTHLLHVWARHTGAVLLKGALLRGRQEPPPGLSAPGAPPSDTPALGAPALGAPPWAGGPVAVDDADEADEGALLRLLNDAADAGRPVLLTGREPPARWPARLPDLGSRLRATVAVEICPPDDDALRALLARLLADRQLRVPEAVQEWLLAHLPRTPAAMREAACRLDRAALAAGGGVTRALAARVAAEMDAAERDGVPEAQRPSDEAPDSPSGVSRAGPALL